MKKYIKYFIFAIFLAIGASLFYIQNNATTVYAQESDGLSIELLGDETIYLLPNSKYVELGAQAYDSIDGDISENIIINSSSINNTVEGTYKVSYKITNSSSQTKTIYRTVIVDDNYEEKTTSSYYNYSGRNNQFYKMIETSDGGYLAVGTTAGYYSSDSYGYIVKYDSNMNTTWYRRISSYSNEYVYDVIENNKQYLFICSYDNNSTIYIYKENGDILLSTTLGAAYQYIKMISNNEYMLLSENANRCIIISYESSTINKKNSITFDYNYCSNYFGFIYEDSLYYLDNNKRIIQYNYQENISTIIKETEYDNIYKDEYIYAYKNNEYLVKLDVEFNEVSRINLDIVGLNNNNNNNNNNTEYILARTSNNSFIYIDKKDFIKYAEYNLSLSDFSTISGHIITKDLSVLVYGRNSSYCYTKKANLLKSFQGLNSETYELYSDINYSELVDIKHPDVTCYIQNTDYSEVDTSKAGVYNVYYTIIYIDDEIKTIQASKEIIISDATSIVDGETYNGHVIIDVEGADVYIDDVEYNYGDIYSVPGKSIMKIVGNNGYEREVVFYIEPTISGVENGATYYEPVNIEISSDYYLNDKKITDSIELFEKGNHTIEIIAENNDYYDIIDDPNFPFIYTKGGTFKSTNMYGEGSSTLTLVVKKDFDWTIYATVKYKNFKIYRNGSYLLGRSGGNSNYSFGTYHFYKSDIITIVVSDYTNSTNQYVSFSLPYDYNYYQTLNFTIEPTILGVDDGQTYYDTIYPQINAENMTLNGQPYNNEPITNCGNYELVITGTGGYTKTLNFVIETIVEGALDEGVYDVSVTPSFTKGTATLNGEEYISGTEITTPGYNTLIITGEDGYSVEYNFTVNRTIEGVKNATVYVGSVTPIISGGRLTLNGKEYVSGTTIDVPGNYYIEINGAAGYYEKIAFVVKPQEINVVNGQTYNHSLIPAISKGTLTLNGEEYISGTVLNVSGTYTLQIRGENGYLETIRFTLVTGANVEDGAVYLNEKTIHFIGEATLNGETIEAGTTINEVGNYCLVLIDGENTFTYNFVIEPDYTIFDAEIINNTIFNYLNADVTLNGEEYKSNTLIDEVGKYTLTVEGVNGYNKTIEFNINPYSNIKDGDVFIDLVNVNVNGGNISVDGESYNGEIYVDEIGNHTITITGVNGYEKTINFVIDPSILNLENFGYYFGKVTPIINSDEMTLNGEVYNSATPITEAGIYTLVVSGVNGYEKTINFIILPSDFEVKANEYYDEVIIIDSCDADIKIDGVAYELNQEFKDYGLHTITLHYNGGYSEYSFFILPFVDGVEDGEKYVESVVINTNYPYLLLDNKTYTSGQEITEIGNHIFVVKELDGYEHVISFTIVEKYDGVEDGGEYIGSISPTIPNGTLLLDGNSYTSGTVINSVGYHTLTITGTNGYEHTIAFTILENTGSFEDGGEYKYSVTISIPNATLLLDGNTFSNGYSVYEVGYHTLTVIGTNGYERDYNFTILPEITFYTNSSSVTFEEDKVYENATHMRVYVSNVQSIALNGKNYSSGSYIYNIGNYTVVIFGTNGYTYEMHFTKDAVVSGAIDGGEYTSYTTLSCDYSLGIELNEKSFANGSRIFTIGNNHVRIYGEDGYVKEIEFVVKPYFYTSGSTYVPETGGIKDAISGARFRLYNSYNGVTLDASHYLRMEIDGEEYVNDTYYYYIGYHKLVVYGVNDYVFEVEFVINPSLSGLYDGLEITAFTPVIYLSNTNTYADDIRYVLIDGVPYNLNTEINEVGNHIISIYGSNNYSLEYNIVILPTVYGLTNGGVYYGSVTPSIDDCELLLDGNKYISSTEIYVVGNHTLTVIGTNGYEVEYNFTITPLNVQNYENKQYYENITIDDIYNCQIFVNGQKYQLGQKITPIGVNIATIYGTNGYVYEFNFTIIEQPKLQTETGSIDFTNKFEADRMVKIFIPNAQLYIDGEEYISGSEYLIVGKHYLTVVGLNGYFTEYEFTIHDMLFGVEDGRIYENVTIICNNAQRLVLNTVEIENGYSLNVVGNYILLVEGTNGYVSSYEFTIIPKIQGIVDGGEYEVSVSPRINSDNITLDGKKYVSGTAITEVGNHTLVIKGGNGYEQTITFLVKEKISGIEFGTTYTSSRDITVLGKCSSITLNGTSVASSFTATDVGNNCIVIYGANEYMNTIYFIIEPVISGVSNGGVYDDAVTVSVSGNCSAIFLNGLLVSNKVEVNTIGYNIIEIYGENGYYQYIEFTLEHTLTGVKNNGVYNELVEISLNLYPAAIMLNNEYINVNDVVNNKLVISTIGNNKLTIETVNGSIIDYNFVIKPVIENFSNNGIYTGSVTPIIKGTVVDYKLNGRSIEVNSTINVVGYNTLLIIGLNGYEERVGFTVEPELVNQPNGALMSFDPIFNGDGKVYLNGKLIANSTSSIPTITTIGNNKLNIYGSNGYVKSYTIIIIPSVSGVENGGVNNIYNIVVSGNCNVYIDDVSVNNEIENYSVIGNHTLTIKGVNGFVYTVQFTVVEDYEIDNIYDDHFKLEYTSGSILIDGELYVSNTSYKKVGNHILTVTGSNGYISEYNICIEPTIINIVDKGVYTNNVAINVTNIIDSIILDNNMISNGLRCDVLGTHTLIIYGTNGYVKKYEFTIEPTIKGIEMEGTYQTFVSWEIGGSANVEIDGVKYNLKDSYSIVGNHTMIISTVYGYVKIINFTILPEINGVTDNETYDSSVTISVAGCTLKLNGQTVEGNRIIVSKVGNYELEIIGSNDYSELIKFTIIEKDLCFVNDGEYSKLLLSGFDNCELVLDGKSIANDTTVVEAGKHILLIVGENGYTSEYSFIIKFEIKISKNTITTNGGRIFVNGVEVEQGYKVTTIGNNKITLVGTNGYEENYELLIEDEISIADGEKFQNRVLVEKINAQVFIDGVEIFEDTYIEKDGEHIIKIVGAGGYEKTIKVEVINTNITYTFIASSVIAICLIGFAVLLIRRKRVI